MSDKSITTLNARLGLFIKQNTIRGGPNVMMGVVSRSQYEVNPPRTKNPTQTREVVRYFGLSSNSVNIAVNMMKKHVVYWMFNGT